MFSRGSKYRNCCSTCLCSTASCKNWRCHRRQAKSLSINSSGGLEAVGPRGPSCYEQPNRPPVPDIYHSDGTGNFSDMSSHILTTPSLTDLGRTSCFETWFRRLQPCRIGNCWTYELSLAEIIFTRTTRSELAVRAQLPV